jgi:glycosyltransferase involved in cell wall biosynthesis
VLAEQKFTQPPARYNEGSLVRELEERGIGRPSTYAEIISKVQARDYVEKMDGRSFRPTLLGKMVVDGLLRARRDLCIDMLVPMAHREKAAFARLATRERLVWHAGLDELQLRELYQTSRVMLLPMQDSGANTAVVEALACGLPVVTTDVGGIRDYGGGSVVSVVEPDDDTHMVETTLRILDHPALQRELSTASRQFAEHDLCWRRVVEQHIDVYSRVISPA